MGRPGAIVLGLGLGACSAAPPAARTGPVAPSIDVVRVVEQPLGVTLSMPGELQPYQTVAIYPKVTGFIKSLRVDRGSVVRSGEVMAELEAPELVAQRAEAQSKLQAAQALLAAARAKADADASTYDRLKAAAATPGVVAGNDLLLAQKATEADQSQVVAAQQNAEAARQALDAVAQIETYLKVTAPFDGVVTERNVHLGALVGPDSGPAAVTAMLRVVQADPLRLVVPVPEAYTAGLAPGAAMPFEVEAYPGRTFSGTLARIAHAVDVKTRTMAVELDVANPGGLLSPGTFCQVKWAVRRPAPSLLVPRGSVANTTDRTFVIRVRDGKAEWVDVRIGLTSGPLTEVFGDLQAGDAVAARGTDEIGSGTAVEAKELKPASS